MPKRASLLGTEYESGLARTPTTAAAVVAVEGLAVPILVAAVVVGRQ
jgi:hypothetical protein